MAEIEAEVEAVVVQFVTEHAAEIAAEQDKPFELTGGTAEETETASAAPQSSPEVVAPPTVPIAAAAVAAAPAQAEPGRESILQKIAKLKVGERVKLAML